jgi:hypothetical protein
VYAAIISPNLEKHGKTLVKPKRSTNPAIWLTTNNPRERERERERERVRVRNKLILWLWSSKGKS